MSEKNPIADGRSWKSAASSLELASVLAFVGTRAQTRAAHARILELEPLDEASLVDHYTRLDAWRKYREGGKSLLLPGIPSRKSLKRSPRLDPFDREQLLEIRDCLEAWVKVQDEPDLDFEHHPEPLPDELANLRKRLATCFDSRGQWSADVSPVYRKLSRRLDRLRDQLEAEMAASLRKFADCLSDSLIQERNCRKVIPVKLSHKSRVRGILQDTSASGRTVFIEPDQAVQIQNELVAVGRARHEELWKIRCELSQCALETAFLAAVICEDLARFDLMQTLVAFAAETRSVAVQPQVDGDLHLIQARHPLLDQRFADLRREVAGLEDPDQLRMIAFDLALDRRRLGLVISGANTGGKTVTLKTTGLLALMANCGIPIPVEEGSKVPVYRHILADIGDHQSITESLSTYASHLAFLKRMLTLEDPQTLVLLDEMGSGTDPQEGNALSQAIVEELLERGFHVILTTHQQVLCTFALNHPKLENGSMVFDQHRLKPTYRFAQGVPGRSHALEIARQAGLTESVLGRAKSLIDDNLVDIQAAIEELQQQAKRLAKTQKKVRRDELRLHRKIKSAEREGRELSEMKQKLEKRARDRIQKKVAQAESQLRDHLREVKSRKQRTKMATSFVELKRGLVAEEADKNPRPTETASGDPSGIAVEHWAKGDRVRFLGQVGRLISVDRGRARVEFVGKTMQLAAKELTHLKPDPTSDQPRVHDQVDWQGAESPASLELDLIGYRVDDALIELDQAIDRALSRRNPFLKIIHGHGTGALRNAIRDFLKRHPSRAAWETSIDPVHDGATELNFR